MNLRNEFLETYIQYQNNVQKKKHIFKYSSCHESRGMHISRIKLKTLKDLDHYLIVLIPLEYMAW